MAGLLVVVGLASLYLMIQSRGFQLPYLQVSDLHKIILLAGELFFCLWLSTIYLRQSWGETKKITYLLVLLLANCFLLVPFIYYYLDQTRADMPVVLAIRPYLLPGYYALLGVTALTALLAWRDVRRLHAWLVSLNDEQRLRDDLDASARRASLLQRRPRLARLPVVGRLVQAIYAEGWVAWLALGLGVAGFALRLWNLDVLPPYADETIHLELGKAVLGGEAFTRLEYRRSLYTVTLPVVLSMKAFGATLWAARFPGVLANSLASLPLYWITRRVNRPVALLAVGLLAFNPWMIATARTVREYAFYPLYFYLVAWLMVRLYEALPDQIVILKDFPRLMTLETLLLMGLLGFVFYYANWYDWLSPFRVILGVYIVFAILLLRKLDWRQWSNALIIFILMVAAYHATKRLYWFTGEINGYYLTLFFDHPEGQWYYNRPLIAIVVLLLALLATEYLDVKKLVLPLSVLSFGLMHLLFAFLYVKGEKPRYAIPIEFWYIPVVAAGLYSAARLGQSLFRYRAVVWVGLLLIFWNIPQTLTPSLYTDPGFAPITYEHHADMDPAYKFLQANSNERDVLVASGYFIFDINWKGGLKFSNIVPLENEDPQGQAKIYSAIEKNPSGWIVLYSRSDFLWPQPVPPEDFEHAGKPVEFMGWYGDTYVLRWGE